MASSRNGFPSSGRSVFLMGAFALEMFLQLACEDQGGGILFTAVHGVVLIQKRAL